MKKYLALICFVFGVLSSDFCMAEYHCRKSEFLGFDARKNSDIATLLKKIDKGDCFSCREKTEVITTTEECSKCPNREMKENKCVLLPCKANEFRDSSQGNDYCYPCKTKRALWTTKEECDKCPNRKRVEGNCILADCGEGFYQTLEGGCMDCSNSFNFPATSEECAKCPERKYYGNNTCVIPGKCAPNETLLPSGECVNCNRRTTKEECDKCPEHFWGKDGECHHCKSSIWHDSGKKADPKECDRCSNRLMFGEYCSLKECEGDYGYPPPMFRDYTGVCFSCSRKESHVSTIEECSKCPNREMQGDRCVLKCAQNEFRLLNGNCLSCEQDDAKIRVRNGKISGAVDWFPKASKEECSKCPLREMKDDLCMIKK